MQLDTRVYRVARRKSRAKLRTKFQRAPTHEVIMNEHVRAATPEPLFNPLSPEFIHDPYPHYARLRTSDPMHLTAYGAYIASRHAEAASVLRDKRFGKDFVDRTLRRYGPK